MGLSAGRGRHAIARAACFACAAAVAAALCGCVVESVTPRDPLADLRQGGLPAISSPATTRSRMALRPLGEIEYDGQTLPLISPDGQFLVVQSGAAPSWDALLFAPEASPPLGQRIAIFSMTGESLEMLVEVDAPAGTVLGRSAASEGFLVERVLDDGSRWIGLVAWPRPDRAAPIAPEWIVADEHACGLATIGPRGEIAFSRRRMGAEEEELVYRKDARRSETETTLRMPGQRLLFPTFSGGGNAGPAGPAGLWVFGARAEREPRAGAPSLIALEIGIDPSRSEPLAIVQRLDWCDSAPGEAAMDAFQSVAALQTPWPAPHTRTGEIRSAGYNGLLAFHPPLGGMVWAPGAGSARTGPETVGEQAHAATPLLASDASARDRAILWFLVADAEGLALEGVSGEAESARVIGAARVLEGSFVCRLAMGARGAEWVLFAPPIAGDSPRLRILHAEGVSEGPQAGSPKPLGSR